MPAILLLALCASAPTAGAQSITSFRPDTTARAGPRPARAPLKELPMWIGIRACPSVGGTAVAGRPRTWDATGIPWAGLSAAWPWTTPQRFWVALGYERWEFSLHPGSVPFGNLILPYISPMTTNQFTVRAGIDQLIGPDRHVSGAFGLGGGTGYGAARIGTVVDSDPFIPIEVIGHALVYVNAGEGVRIGAGVSGGPTWLWWRGDPGEPFLHWELELRLEHLLHPPKRRAPGS